ncbi:MAG: sugar phosphate isomerase/epimerase [Ginsengibacter sp.]
MYPFSRRKFIKVSSAAAVLTSVDPSFILKRKELKLSFSTLGCPDWSFTKIVDFAYTNKYRGLEIRGIKRQLDLSKVPEFAPENIPATMKLMNDHQLQFVDLGSSCELHHAKPEERKKHLNEGKRFIDLAQEINCPYIRVFPNLLPKDQDREETIQLIISGLLELGNYAKSTGVTVLLESHGELVNLPDLKHILIASQHPNVGLVWDIVNMWSVTKDEPEHVYNELKQYIKHTHIKDCTITNGVYHYTLLGQGETPIFNALDVLYKNNYPGFYSFEWEKLWHPEILEPEVAIADYPRAMKRHFNINT